MVRCSELYEKVEREWTDWCKKAPQTAARITKFLEDIWPELEAEIAKSEILEPENCPIGQILSETASRPLVSIKDPKTRSEVMTQIVKVAEEKLMDGVKPQVTEKEVKTIIQRHHTTVEEEDEDGYEYHDSIAEEEDPIPKESLAILNHDSAKIDEFRKKYRFNYLNQAGECDGQGACVNSFKCLECGAEFNVLAPFGQVCYCPACSVDSNSIRRHRSPDPDTTKSYECIDCESEFDILTEAHIGAYCPECGSDNLKERLFGHMLGATCKPWGRESADLENNN